MRDILTATTETLDSILSGVFRLPLRKALNPNKDKDFIVIVDRIARDLMRRTWETEAYALERALRELGVAWPKLPKKEQERILREVQKKMRPAWARAERRAQQVLADYAEEIYTDTVRDVSATRSALSASRRRSFSRLILIYIKALREEQARRWDRHIVKAERTTSIGIAAGLTAEKIVASVKSTIKQDAARAAESYSRILASIHANTVRTVANLAAFNAQGVRNFRFEAVLDARTSEVCRFMHGRVFSVPAALLSFDAAVAAGSLEELAATHPWAHVSDNRILVRTGEKNKEIATVEEAGAGIAGKIGRYSTEYSDVELEALGVAVPPLHPHCRSTIVAVP